MIFSVNFADYFTARLLRTYCAKSARAQKNRTSLLRTRSARALLRACCAFTAQRSMRSQYGGGSDAQ